MINNSKTQREYFINLDLWQDALDLFNFQIKQKETNRHFNTLSMCYYEKFDKSCLNDAVKDYYKIKISSRLFYGLKEEFAIFPYVIPKPGLGLRDYKFFTYPMRIVYYAVGLYLLKLSQEFLFETYKKIGSIEAFYGGNLNYKSQKLQLNPKNIYHRSFYLDYQSKIQEETKSRTQDKVVLKLDIENYFNELSVPKLLDLLSDLIKPSVKTKMVYDTVTREEILCLFQFFSNGKPGIPQAENDVVSSFIGYLYLVFGDMLVDDLLKNNKDIIDSYKIIRYTDDINIFITLKKKESQGSFIHSIASQIADILYSKLGLKLNRKTILHHLWIEEEKEELIKNINKSSLGDEYFSAEPTSETPQDKPTSETPQDKPTSETPQDKPTSETPQDKPTSETPQDKPTSETPQDKPTSEIPQDKLNKIFEELEKIKQSKIEDYLMRGNSVGKEIFQNIFDKKVEETLNKPENTKKIQPIFENFNFDLVKVQPLEILIILLKDETITNEFRKFCLKKTIITTGDAHLIIKFLCQTNFSDKELLDKLRKNVQMTKIVDIILSEKLNCDKPGYYNLTCMHMKNLSEMPNVLEQTRLRILNERSKSYSVALNHLVNEIHAVCLNKDKDKVKKNKYDVNDVVIFLKSKGIKHQIYIKVRNLFNRRNSNSISHPSSDKCLALGVTEEEYLDYYNYVGQCFYFLF